MVKKRLEFGERLDSFEYKMLKEAMRLERARSRKRVYEV
jgi:hypothetical protein